MLLTFAIFVSIWFMTIFILLPIGLQRDDAPVPGQPLSAPKNLNIKRKIIANTVISAMLTAAIVGWHWYGAPL